MALNGTGARWLESITIDSGIPGGILRQTVIGVPTGSYPANGEDLATFFGQIGAGHLKWNAQGGVDCTNVQVTDNLGHFWTYDGAQGTIGTLRNWTAIGATPTEHATGAYGGNETTAILRITFDMPLYCSMTR